MGSYRAVTRKNTLLVDLALQGGGTHGAQAALGNFWKRVSAAGKFSLRVGEGGKWAQMLIHRLATERVTGLKSSSKMITE